MSDRPNPEKSGSIPFEDAFIASVSLYEGFHRDLWLDDRPLAQQPPQPAGVVTFLDLRHASNIRFRSPVNLIHFYFSRKAINAASDEESGKAVDELATQLLMPSPDVILHRLALSLVPALNKPSEASRLFVDHMTMAASAHFAKQYAKRASPGRIICGGLAPWQLMRAKELMASNLDGSISLAQVATECRLSTRHFARAFAQSTGVPPHRWLLQRRVERAKELLHDAKLSLLDVAVQSGFADQSHLTRVFSRSVGETPGAWRRMSAC
jgi:AraC-like DNA-binding protein